METVGQARSRAIASCSWIMVLKLIVLLCSQIHHCDSEL